MVKKLALKRQFGQQSPSNDRMVKKLALKRQFGRGCKCGQCFPAEKGPFCAVSLFIPPALPL
jgi:hypothetical protein